MRKILVILTPVLCAAGIALRILFPGAEDAGATLGGQHLSYVAMLSLLVMVFALVTFIVTHKQKTSEIHIGKPAGIILFIAAVAVGFDALIGLIENFTSEIGIDVFPLCLNALEFISAIILVVFACTILTGFDFKYEKSLIFALIPLFWLLIKLSYEFLGYTRVANISDHYFPMLMTAGTVMFLLYYFKSAANKFSVSAGTVICLSLPAAFFSFTAVVPSAVKVLRETDASFLEAVTGFDIACLLIGIFAFVTAIKLAFAKEEQFPALEEYDDEN